MQSTSLRLKLAGRGRGALLRMLAAPLVAAVPSGAIAGHDVFHVFTPVVEKGHWGLEVINAFQRGLAHHDDEGDGGHKPVRAAHEVALHGGLSDLWMTKLALGLGREDGGSVQVTSVASENVLRMSKEAYGPIDFAWFTAVSAGLASGATNTIEVGPIVSFEHGRFAVVLNPLFEKSFGDNREAGVAFVYAVRASYEISDRLSVGMEAYGEIENIANAPPLGEQTHRLGPVVYLGHMHGARRHHDGSANGHGGDHGHDRDHGVAQHTSPTGDWHAEVGVLFGLTQASPDAALKINFGTDF